MTQIIDTLEKLQDVLKTYTGSATVSYQLNHLFGSDYIRTDYVAYSRGKNTLVFKKDAVENQLTLLEVFPKIKLTSFKDGVDADLIYKVYMIAPVAWKVTSAYSTHLTLSLNVILTEQQIVEILKLGFSDAWFYDNETNFTIT